MALIYIVGTSIEGRTSPVEVEAEDALAAALSVKRSAPTAKITYVRKKNDRGDGRHPHERVH